MIFPDTVFFKDGKPVMIVKMDKDYCLSSVKNQNKLGLHNLYKDFQNVARERRKDNVGIFEKKYGPGILSEDVSYSQPYDAKSDGGAKKRHIKMAMF